MKEYTEKLRRNKVTSQKIGILFHRHSLISSSTSDLMETHTRASERTKPHHHRYNYIIESVRSISSPIYTTPRHMHIAHRLL